MNATPHPVLRPASRSVADVLRPAPHLALLAAAFALSGCGGEGADAPETEIDLVEVLRIDPEGDPSRTPFGRVSDIEVGADGSIYVLDALGRNVRVFDRDGAEVVSFGQQGQGPGEFELPGALFWGPEGNLWVADLRSDRFTVFTPTGDLVTTYSNGGPAMLEYPVLRFSADGRLSTVGVALPGGSLEGMETVLAELDVAGNEVAPTEIHSLPFVRETDVFEHSGDGMIAIIPVPFSGEPHFRIGPSGTLWYLNTAEARVHRWSTEAGLEHSFGGDLAPERLSEIEREAAIEDEVIPEDRAALGVAGMQEFTSRIPDTKPPVSGFFLGEDEEVWVIRASAPDAARDRAPIDVYRRDGTQRGIARAKVQPRPYPRVRDGRLVGVERDDLGVESIVVWEVSR